jgi:hypothetical protein
MLGDESPDLVADLLCVGEEQAPLRPQDQKPVKGFVIGVIA